jgi:hypothetical protein
MESVTAVVVGNPPSGVVCPTSEVLAFDAGLRPISSKVLDNPDRQFQAYQQHKGTTRPRLHYISYSFFRSCRASFRTYDHY